MPEMTNLNIVAIDIDAYDELIHRSQSCAFSDQTLDIIYDTLLDHTYHVVGDELGTISDEELAKEIITILRYRHPAIFRKLLEETKRREDEEE